MILGTDTQDPDKQLSLVIDLIKRNAVTFSDGLFHVSSVTFEAEDVPSILLGLQTTNDDMFIQISGLQQKLSSLQNQLDLVVSQRNELAEANTALTQRVTDLEDLRSVVADLKKLPDSVKDLDECRNQIKIDNDAMNLKISNEIQTLADINEKLPELFKNLSASILDVKTYITSSVRDWIIIAQQAVDGTIKLDNEVDSTYENLDSLLEKIADLNEVSKTCMMITDNLSSIYSLYDNIVGKVPNMKRLDDIVSSVEKLQKVETTLEGVSVLLDGIRTANEVRLSTTKKDVF